jgi:hypothetical protein
MISEKEYTDKIFIWKDRILAEDKLDSKCCDSLANKILEYENYILSLGPANYPQTPPNTITSRHEYYNFLEFDWDELKEVEAKIIENASKILGGSSFYVKMWANVFRNGECITKHIHHPEPVRETDEFKNNIFKTLCGHLFLRNDVDSDTIYHFDSGTQNIKNVKGDFHFFCCVVPHEVLPYEGTERIGLAFDVYTNDFFEGIGIPTPFGLKLIK